MKTRTCVCCLKEKIFVHIKTYANTNAYVDENGSYWSGIYCPQCVSNGERKKHRDRRKREEEKLMKAAQYGTNWDNLE